MVGGGIVVAIGLLILGWTKEIVGFFIPESELVLQPYPLVNCRADQPDRGVYLQ